MDVLFLNCVTYLSFNKLNVFHWNLKKKKHDSTVKTLVYNMHKRKFYEFYAPKTYYIVTVSQL